MGGSLSALIDMICSGEFVPVDKLSQRLSKRYGDALDTKEAVSLYLREYDLIQGIGKLIDSDETIVRMAQTLKEDLDDDEDREKAIRQLLRGLSLPFSPEAVEPLGAESMKGRLDALIQRIEVYERQDRLKELDLRGHSLDGWGYVERILRLTIYFYEQVFSNTDEAIRDVFIRARQQESLGPLFKAMRDIEKEFETADDLKEECIRRFKRPSPFAEFRVDDYHEKDQRPKGERTIQKYRNFYAHSTPEDIALRGSGPVKEALRTTRRLINELIDKEIAPSIIYFTAKGQDEYERALLWFVGEQNAHLSLRERQPKNCDFMMFLRGAHSVDLLKPYITVARIKPVMVEPPVFRHLE